MLKKLLNGKFLYGTQFFRPPNPPREQRMEDLKNISKMGLNIIKLLAEWNWINYREGIFDFDEVIEIIEESGKLGIIVDVNTRIENAPYWVAEKYPESHYVDSRGNKLYLQARSNTPTGGWPGLCYDHQGARSSAEMFLKKCGEVLGKYENVIFDCWNEPHIEGVDGTGSMGIEDQLFCYCESTIKKYRAWLQEKYGNIDNINSLWFKRYRDFKDIRPPRKLIDYVEMMEWRKFMTWSMAEQMGWRYRAIKDSCSPDKIVMSHSVSHGILNGFSLFGCDDYQLSEHPDLYGLTLYPKWANSDAYDVCSDIDATTGMSRGKACINAELQAGECICNPTALSMSKAPGRNDFRLWNFINLSSGIKGVIYWQYREEMLGHEAPGVGLNKRDGSPTYRTDEVAKIGNFINKYPALFNSIKVPSGDVAIIINRDSLYLNFASERNEDLSTCSIRGIHRFLLKNGIKADFLIDGRLEEKLKNYRIAFMPVPLVMDEKIAGIIKEYVAGGGIIISDCAAGYFDKFGVAQERVPSFGLEEVFGVRKDSLRQFDAQNREEVITVFWPEHHNIPPKPDMYLKGTGKFDSCRVKVDFFLENYLVGTAGTILESDGRVAGTVNSYKGGRAYMIGTMATRLLLFDNPDNTKLFEKILASEGFALNKNNNLIIRNFDRADGSNSVLFVINPSMEEASGSYGFQGGIKIVDYFDDRCIDFNLDGSRLDFRIGPEDGACIIYKNSGEQ
ncbi:MAG: beta-galactosidase [Actinobacteria bacterium]|nr:beta-galactosidase [Actinomycetota bacterium]